MTKDEALKLALEALHYCEALNRPVHEQKIHAIKAIKEALDECDEDELIIRYHEMTIKRLEKRIEELTAQPQQSIWVGLTGQEKALIASVSLDVHDAVHRTDAKLKEKNT
jgi:chromosome condensin MukBEF ATPase and DNA-binding subunit MukB